MISRRKFLQWAVGMALVPAGLGSYGFYIEPVLRLSIRWWPMNVSGWPEEALPLRILALADFHIAHPWMTVEHIARIVDRAMNLHPDLIVLLGDYLPGVSSNWAWGFPTIPECTQALAPLQAPHGVYAVLGNHDVEKEAVREGLRRVNIPALSNKAVRLERGGGNFWVAGLADQEIETPDLPGTLAQTAESEPVILLAHEPYIFPEVARSDKYVALTLAGHTHGGQVALPLLGSIASLIGQRYVHGHFIENGRNLIVSAGLGCTRVPVRFLVPPEITVIELIQTK
jgi:predicted MPP superfamily phosphohydrolase